MTKDYQRRSSKNTKRKTGVRPLFFVLIAFGTGYLTALLYSPEQSIHWLGAKIQQSLNESNQVATAPQAAVQKEIPKPKFEFYTLLTKEQHKKKKKNVFKPEVKVEEAKPTQIINEANNYQYIIQVASYTSNKDAERLKAKLTLQGFDVRIINISRANKLWYRVMIGPYTNKVKAERAQTQIARSEHVMGMLRKQKV